MQTLPQIIDLSESVKTNDGEPLAIKVKSIGHKDGADKFGLGLIWNKNVSLIKNLNNLLLFIDGKRRITRHSFPDDEFISLEIVTLNSHAGTHMDSPAHFGSKCENKKPKTIDEIPLEWCYGDGVVLDLRYKKKGEFIGVDDIKNALQKISYKVKANDIVLIMTGSDKNWGKKEYFYDAPGMSSDATEFLINNGVKVIGIDSYGFDRPFCYMINDYFKTHNQSYLWPAHVLGRKHEYVHIERMCNLDKIPKPYGFKVCCLPIKIENIGASWVRAIAILE